MQMKTCINRYRMLLFSNITIIEIEGGVTNFIYNSLCFVFFIKVDIHSQFHLEYVVSNNNFWSFFDVKKTVKILLKTIKLEQRQEYISHPAKFYK